jgi:hypothetical protein
MKNIVTALLDSIDADPELALGFAKGKRVQFYRKGYAEQGDKAPTLAISGKVTQVDPKTGWLTVEHKWGVAIVKPEEEKVQVLQNKKVHKHDTEAEFVDEQV